MKNVNKKARNSKSKFIFLITLLVTLIICFSIFSTPVANAKAVSEMEVLESKLSNSSITNDYVDEVSEEIEVIYEQYISYDSNEHMYLKIDEIPEEYYDESTIEMIETNIYIMNQLVDEGVAMYDSQNELEIINDEFAQQWAAWGFQISWNKLSVNFDKDFAKMFAFGCLAANVTLNINSVKSLANYIGKDGFVSAILVDAFTYLPADIGSGIVSYFTNSTVLGYLCDIFPIMVGCLTSSSIAGIVLSIIMPILLPSIVDCVIVLYNACRYNKGVNLKICWIPWFGDKWGLSLSSI